MTPVNVQAFTAAPAIIIATALAMLCMVERNRTIYFIISAAIIPCLINISCVTISDNISIECIPISPMLKSTFGAGFLRFFAKV